LAFLFPTPPPSKEVEKPQKLYRVDINPGINQWDNKNEAGQSPASAISSPKGDGAISNMGEKFAAHLVTGTGSITVPIATSPGRSGFDPRLAISYDPGAGNEPFGFGWSLSLPFITCKTDKRLTKH
jgi:hypothetical protein